MILLLLALVVAKQVDLVKDPWMQSLTFWNADPETLFHRESFATVGPSVPDGLFTYCSKDWSSEFCTLSTEIELPDVDSVTLVVAAQTGGQDAFSLKASYQGFSWTWSELGQNVYKNMTILITLGVPSNDLLKLTFQGTNGKPDYLSVNEVHLFAEVSDSSWTIVVIVFAILLLLACLILLCLTVKNKWRRS